MRAVLVALSASLGACGSCGSCAESRSDGASDASVAPSSSTTAAAAAIAESLPRCRADGRRLVVDGEDVVVGTAAFGSPSSSAGAAGQASLLVGVVRKHGASRVASIVRVAEDLSSKDVVDVAPSFGDDPPPVPRWNDGPFVTFLVRTDADAGAARGGTRELRVARVAGAAAEVVYRVRQQADESTAYDVAWPDGAAPTAPPIVAWDEDALVAEGKLLPERGVIKVLLPGGSANVEAKPRTVSPSTSDAESPRVAPRAGGGFWVAWLARRAEVEDAGARDEAPGDARTFTWVEAVAVDASGAPVSAVRRLSPEKGRVAAFEIVRGESQLMVIVQDEGAKREGAGARLVRYTLDGDAPAELVDGDVGHALFELALPPDRARGGFLVWKDTGDHAWLAPMWPNGGFAGKATVEAALDGTRVLSATSPTTLIAASGAELRRFVCESR